MPPRRGRAAGLALALGALLAVVAAVPALAVFPGSTGRLAAGHALYDPPGATAVQTYPMGSVRFSPDGKRVTGVSGGAIWVANTDGSDARQLTTPPTGAKAGPDISPTWSADGTEIYFIRQPQVTCGTSTCEGAQLVAVDPTTGATRDITSATNTTYYIAPEASPVPGSHQLVAVSNAAGPRAVTTFDTQTGAAHAVSVNPAYPHLGYWSARYSPDGASIVIGSGVPEDGRGSVEVMPVGGGADTMSFDLQAGIPATTPVPTFTPDGQWVTFYDCRPGCGVWSAKVPQPTDPAGAPITFRQDLADVSPDQFQGSLDWEPLVNAPIITAGPSGRTRDDSPAFEFSIPSDQPGHYQCRLDGGGWAACTSPRSYSGLGDGTHTFDVRFYVDGDGPDDAPVASRTWTIDTTPPQAVIDQAPSGKTTSTSATIAFHSTEPSGATFECREDGGPAYDCNSPQRLAGLKVGTHTFSVRAADDVGNEQTSATQVSWQVAEPAGNGGGGKTGAGGITPPQTPSGDCGKNRFSSVSAGAVVAVGRGGTCFTRQALPNGTVNWTGGGTITLNGVQMTPSRRFIVLHQNLNTIDLELPAGTTLGLGSFTWTLSSGLDAPIGTAAGVAHFAIPKGKGEFEVAGLKVAGSIDFQLGTGDGGSSTVSLDLELPGIFKGAAGGKSKAEDLSFGFKFIASNAKGVRFTFKAGVTGAWLFGKVELTQLSVALDQGPPLSFEGSATVKFPKVTGEFSIALGLSGAGEQAFPNVTKLALQASKLQKPIAEGVFLQRLGGEFDRCTGSDGQTGGQVSASAGVSFGPHLEIKPIFEGEPASLDGTVTLSLCQPKSVAVSGAGKIVEVPVGDASAKYTWSKGRVDLTGNLDLTVGGWGFIAGIKDAFFDTPKHVWNVEGTGRLRLPSLTGGVLDGEADVVLSSNGLAACFGPAGARAGISKHWGEELQKFFLSCDVGPYRAASAQAAAAGRRFTVAKGARLESLALRGAGAPPRVTLSGPGGARVDTPADGSGAKTARALVVPDPATDTTYVVLYSPAAGTWTVTPQAGAAAPTSLRIADALPAVRVHAKVRGGGAKRALSWSLRKIAGQRVTFVERGAAVDHVLATTTHATGHVRFTPAVAPGRARRVEALVSEHGLPRDQRVVARFRAPAPPRLRAVRGLRLRGATLRWRRQPAAASYSVLLRASNGPTFAATPSHAHLRVPARLRHGRLTVELRALDARQALGPLHRARIWAGPSPAAVRAAAGRSASATAHGLRRLRLAGLRKGRALVARAGVPGAGALSERVTATAAGKHVTLAGTTATFTAAGHPALRLLVSSAGRAFARRHPHLAVTVRVAFRPEGGNRAARSVKLRL